MRALQHPQQPSPPPGRGGWDAPASEATQTPWTLSSLVLAGAVAASGAAGAIHFAAVGDHWRTYRLAGIFFVLIGAFQVLWAALVTRRATRGLYVAAAAANAATIAVWAHSRTIGLPFGPSPGVPQAVGRPDVVATVFEELVVIGLVVLVRARGDLTPLARRTYRAWLTLIAALTVPATVWALTAIHGGGGPLDLARRSSPAADAAPVVGVGPAVVAAMLLLYLGAAARTGRPALSWSPSPTGRITATWGPARTPPAPAFVHLDRPVLGCERPPRPRDSPPTTPARSPGLPRSPLDAQPRQDTRQPPTRTPEPAAAGRD